MKKKNPNEALLLFFGFSLVGIFGLGFVLNILFYTMFADPYYFRNVILSFMLLITLLTITLFSLLKTHKYFFMLYSGNKIKE